MPLSSLSPEDKEKAEQLWERLFDDIHDGKITESLNRDIRDFLDPGDLDLKKNRLENFANAKKNDDLYLRQGEPRPTNRAIVDRLEKAFEGLNFKATYYSEEMYSIGHRNPDDGSHIFKRSFGKS